MCQAPFSRQIRPFLIPSRIRLFAHYPVYFWKPAPRGAAKLSVEGGGDLVDLDATLEAAGIVDGAALVVRCDDTSRRRLLGTIKKLEAEQESATIHADSESTLAKQQVEEAEALARQRVMWAEAELEEAKYLARQRVKVAEELKSALTTKLEAAKRALARA